MRNYNYNTLIIILRIYPKTSTPPNIGSSKDSMSSNLISESDISILSIVYALMKECKDSTFEGVLLVIWEDFSFITWQP